MHSALTVFIEEHPELAVGAVEFVDEGTFTSVTRMRTLTPLVPHCKHDGAVTLELRGKWPYPAVTIGDCHPLDPDPPVILVRDARDAVLARLMPKTMEDVAMLLRDEVYDVGNVERRKVQLVEMEEERARQVQTETFLAQRRMELNVQLRTVVQSTVAKCTNELREIARQLVAQLNTHSTRVYVGFEEYSEVGAPHAFEGGVPQAMQAVSREVERLMHLELMREASVSSSIKHDRVF